MCGGIFYKDFVIDADTMTYMLLTSIHTFRMIKSEYNLIAL